MGFDSFHLLDADVWKELPDKKILDNGYMDLEINLAIQSILMLYSLKN